MICGIEDGLVPGAGVVVPDVQEETTWYDVSGGGCNVMF